MSNVSIKNPYTNKVIREVRSYAGDESKYKKFCHISEVVRVINKNDSSKIGWRDSDKQVTFDINPTPDKTLKFKFILAPTVENNGKHNAKVIYTPGYKVNVVENRGKYIKFNKYYYGIDNTEFTVDSFDEDKNKYTLKFVYYNNNIYVDMNSVKNVMLKDGYFEQMTFDSSNSTYTFIIYEKPKELKISLDGLKLLAEMEVNSNSKYVVKENGELKGIITHDVGDGGLTVGYGFYIKGGMNNSSEINRLKNEYGIIVQEGAIVDIDKVLKLYYESIIRFEELAKNYVNNRGLSPLQHEFDALVIQAYNGTHYDVMDAFVDKNLNDEQSLERALQKYRTFKTWNIHGNGWTNRLRNIINLYRHGNYTKLY